jgi:glycosyltransferase involved in cell wall biosynthesis
MKIALVAPPLLPIPPLLYGGVERIVAVLADGLFERGHEVTLFAPGDSRFAGELVPTVPSGLWNDGFAPDPSGAFRRTVELVQERASDFDLIHNHLDFHGFELADRSPVPVISTLHGRTDMDPLAGAIRAHPDALLVAISNGQRSFEPDANWIATIHHGLEFKGTADYSRREPDLRDGYLAFVGRLSRDKGIYATVDLARMSGHKLRVAAKVLDPGERQIYTDLIEPAVVEGVVEFIGELGAHERDRLMGDALATVMLSKWPEPFGLVAIESLAVGTPVIALRSGALPEIVIDGVDGFIVDDAAGGAARVPDVRRLDRARIRQRTLERFAAARMLDDYERVFAEVLSQRSVSERV